MNAPLTIARRTAPDPLGFDALRALAIERAQAASGELWTDYNLHDPGVSMLEALCFALTEDVFASRQPVPTLLGLDERSPRAAWERLGLHTRDAVLPCRPVSEADWRLWLGHALPGTRQLAMNALKDWRGRATGLWRMTLQAGTDRPDDDRRLRERALRVFHATRALGEDLAEPPRLLAPRWVRLELHLSVATEQDLGDVLTEVLRRCDAGVSRRVQTPLDGQDDPDPPPGLTDDPDLPGGPMGRPTTRAERRWLAEDDDFLYASDLGRLLQDVPGVASVEGLWLRAVDPDDDRPEDTTAPPGSVARRGRDWALRLRWPSTPQELRGWVIRRDGLRVQLTEDALLAQLALQRRADHARDTALQGAQSSDLSAAATAGVGMGIGTATAASVMAPPPLPARRDGHLAAVSALPPLYDEALRLREATQPGLRHQWLGYAALLEVGLNQAQQQREQLPRLFALDDPELRSYWHEWPGNAQLADIESLYLVDRRQAQDDASLDADRLGRRHRFLDFQLALHGEALDQTVLDGLPRYHAPDAWPRHLLLLKRDFMRRVIRLGRDRGAGADLSRPLLGERDNTPPLQERLGLMLGLARTESRALTRVLAMLQAAGLRFERERLHRPPARRRGETSSSRHGHGPGPGQGQAAAAAPTSPLLDPSEPRLPNAQVHWGTLARRLKSWADAHHETAVPLAMLRAAVDPSRFRHDPDTGQLRLAADTERDWVLAEALAPDAARRFAREFHAAACLMQADGEGLHLVEHLLLRPMATPPTPATGSATEPLAADQRVSVVMAGWTARGQDRRFRQIAAQALEREAPVHLRCTLVWLDAPDMLAFEALWQAWLKRRLAYEQGLLSGDAASLIEPLDDAASVLSRWLRRWHARQRPRHASRAAGASS
ncbi:hypothetical protein ACNI65_09690 [Roseateles sp. So40a]|uniref:hypothetical protein n=1 Tax=Roseateles sp. So40a TaxID=3400226 RepID=UPI003A856920